MAALIKGITVTLHAETVTGYDEWGNEEVTKSDVTVDNVLVRPLTTEEQITDFNFYGEKSIYELCIPKGDTKTWTNRVVTFFGQDWFVFSPPSQTIDEMTPLDWNAHYKVKRYE